MPLVRRFTSIKKYAWGIWGNLLSFASRGAARESQHKAPLL